MNTPTVQRHDISHLFPKDQIGTIVGHPILMKTPDEIREYLRQRRTRMETHEIYGEWRKRLKREKIAVERG